MCMIGSLVHEEGWFGGAISVEKGGFQQLTHLLLIFLCFYCF